VRIAPLLNSEALGLRAVTLKISVKESEKIEDLQHTLAKCPRLLFFGKDKSRKEIEVVFIAENSRVVECIKNACSFTNILGLKIQQVRELDILLPKYVRVRIPTQHEPNTPCGNSCSECPMRNNIKCPGCPATEGYRGTLPH